MSTKFKKRKLSATKKARKIPGHNGRVFLNQQQAVYIMNIDGLLIGAATFLIIGLFHPIVIKAEYYLGVKCWWIFLIAGILGVFGSLFVGNSLLSTLLGVLSFSSFWSIKELFEQRERVRKGWFPKNPKK
jgi:hypothetical protein